jgi:hypothetical protein
MEDLHHEKQHQNAQGYATRYRRYLSSVCIYVCDE